MGITIYYKGKLKNKDEVYSLKDDLVDFAETMNWEWHALDNDWDKPASAELDVKARRAEIKGHLPLKGVSLQLHPNCETLTLYFDQEGRLMDPIGLIMIREGRLKPQSAYLSVKTQFAPPEVHISIIKLLEFLKNRYIPDLEVMDEGGYWESRDEAALRKSISFLNEQMDRMEEILSTIGREEVKGLSTEELARLIEQKLKNWKK